MYGKQILVIDDDLQLLGAMEQALRWAGGHVYTASNGPEGLRQFQAHSPDLIILDVMMPEMDGWETCRHIRQSSQVPILMLTALKKDNEIMQGLNSGADDYLVKPFTADVLVTRTLALLERTTLPKTPKASTHYNDDYLTVDLSKHKVLVDGQSVRLSQTEYRLLSYLLRNSNRVLSFQHILENVWDAGHQGNIDEVHAHISDLRQKLEKDPQNPYYLLTEPEIGYRFLRLSHKK